MGYYSLFAISHDMSDFIENNPQEFLQYLRYYMNSGDPRSAEALARATRGAVAVVSIRHHSEVFTISQDRNGFPAKLPYNEQKALDEAEREDAVNAARSILDIPGKKRPTIVQLLDVIRRLLKMTADKRELIARAKDADERATRKLADPNWRPSRAHVEGLRNDLRRMHEALEG